MPTVGQALQTLADPERPVRLLLGTVKAVAAPLATVTLQPGGAVITARVPLDLAAVAPGSLVIVAVTSHLNVVLGRL